jgi:3-oxoacid CoA-transferase
VEDGEIPPEHVHVPGVYVDRIYKQDPNSIFSKKIIEKYPIKPDPTSTVELTETDKAKYKITKRLAKEVKPGMNVNLGVGIPLLLPSELPK